MYGFLRHAEHLSALIGCHLAEVEEADGRALVETQVAPGADEEGGIVRPVRRPRS